MRRRTALAAVVGALVAAAPAGAAQPPAPLVQALTRTAHASSLHVSMTMTIVVAGKKETFETSGVERPKAHQASMVVDLSQIDPALGKMKVLSIGRRYYIHYDFLDALRATQPKLEPWIAADGKAALGFDPWSLNGDVGASLRAATDIHLLGRRGGVTRYGAKLDLRRALTLNPQLKQLLNGVGAAASGMLDKPLTVDFDIGADGYLDRVLERFSLRFAGQAMSMAVDLRMSDFGNDPGPIAAPPASQVMTLAVFKRLTGSSG